MDGSCQKDSDSASFVATGSTCSTVPGVITEEWTEPSSTVDIHGAAISSQNASSRKITSSVNQSPRSEKNILTNTNTSAGGGGGGGLATSSSSHGQEEEEEEISTAQVPVVAAVEVETSSSCEVNLISNDQTVTSTSTSLSNAPEKLLPQLTQRSPTPSSLAVTLQVPASIKSPSSANQTPSLSTRDLIFSEETVVINRYKQLATAVFGLMKSFSTSDITLESSEQPVTSPIVRSAVSESSVNPSTTTGVQQSNVSGAVASNIPIRIIGDIYSPTRLDYNCRSISTWVAVGDVANSSQIPSPVTHTAESIVSSIAPSISPMYLVRSVNKKVRRMYIKKRILSTYKALERMSRSQLDLTTNTLTAKSNNNGTWNPLSTSPSTLSISAFAAPTGRRSIASIVTAVDSSKCNLNYGTNNSPPTSPKDQESTCSTKGNIPKSDSKLAFNNLFGEGLVSLTTRDIDLQKGKPLSKYDRNMIIFNWLQELDEPPIPDQLLST